MINCGIHVHQYLTFETQTDHKPIQKLQILSNILIDLHDSIEVPFSFKNRHHLTFKGNIGRTKVGIEVLVSEKKSNLMQKISSIIIADKLNPIKGIKYFRSIPKSFSYEVRQGNYPMKFRSIGSISFEHVIIGVAAIGLVLVAVDSYIAYGILTLFTLIAGLYFLIGKIFVGEVNLLLHEVQNNQISLHHY